MADFPGASFTDVTVANSTTKMAGSHNGGAAEIFADCFVTKDAFGKISSSRATAGIVAEFSGVNANSFQFDMNGTGRSTLSAPDFSVILENRFASGDVRLRTNGVDYLVVQSDGRVRPGADNTQPFGSASLRWSVLFAATGTINTSDARDKANFRTAESSELDFALASIAEYGFHQWNDAVAEKGADGARWHFSPLAQGLWSLAAKHGLCDALGKNGLPKKDGKAPPAVLCFDEWDDELEAVTEEFEVEHIEFTNEPTGTTVTIDGEEMELHRRIECKTMRTERRLTGKMRVERAGGNRFGVRIDQLHSLQIAALAARVAALASE